MVNYLFSIKINSSNGTNDRLQHGVCDVSNLTVDHYWAKFKCLLTPKNQLPCLFYALCVCLRVFVCACVCPFRLHLDKFSGFFGLSYCGNFLMLQFFLQVSFNQTDASQWVFYVSVPLGSYNTASSTKNIDFWLSESRTYFLKYKKKKKS